MRVRLLCQRMKRVVAAVICIAGLDGEAVGAGDGPDPVDDLPGAIELCDIDGDRVFDDGHSVVINGVGNDVNVMTGEAECVLTTLDLPEWVWPFVSEVDGAMVRLEFDDYVVLVAPDGDNTVVVVHDSEAS